ncbi:MAG: hypothetical protein RLZZ196_249 [Bacteroidota bacterium]|jgi:hypothetical protein
MIKIVDFDYKLSIRFKINDVQGNECLMTLLYEMDVKLNKFIIQYYSNLLMGSRININNKLHIPISDSSESINISFFSTIDILRVFINRKLVYMEERGRSKNVLVLIGRPFFGKTISTFNQFFKQSALRYIALNSFLKLKDKDKVGYRYVRSSYIEKFEIRNSSHNLLNPLDKAKKFNLETFNSFGEYHKIAYSTILNMLSQQISLEIANLIADEEKKGVEYIQYLENKSLHEKLTIHECESLLKNLYVYRDVYDVEEDIFFNICADLLDRKNDSEIALYILADIYFNEKDYGPMIRVLSCIKQSPLDLYLIENYFIFLWSLTINQQINYFNERIYELILKTKSNNLIYFGALVSMLEVLFNSFHYSKRGSQYSRSIDELLMRVNDLEPSGEIMYKEFAIGVLNMMAQRPIIASNYFAKAMELRHEASHYLVRSLENSGEIRKARDLLLETLLSTCRFKAEDPLVLHYSTLDNWVNKIDNIRYDSEDKIGESTVLIPFKPHKGLLFKAIDNIYLADHDFKIGLQFSKKMKNGLLFQYSNSLQLFGNADNLSLKISINGQTYLLNMPRIEIKKNNFAEISRFGDLLAFKFNGAVKEIRISKDAIIYGGRLIFDNSCFDITNYYVDVYKYKSAIKSNKIVIYSSWYGDEFTELFFNSLLPSLSRPDGLPSLKKSYEIEWRIYTTEEQKKKIIDEIPKFKNLFNKLTINTTILKSENFDPREYLHETFIDCVRSAIPNNSIVLFAPPDHIFGSGLNQLVDNCEIDEYIISPHPRVSYEDTFQLNNHGELIFKNKLNAENGYLSNIKLAALAINKYAHPIVNYGLNPTSVDGYRENSFWWSAVKNGNNISVQFKEPPPVLFHARGDIVAGMLSEGYSSTFERVDHDLVEWMYKTKRLKVIDSNKDFFWVEYCKKGRNIPTLMNGYWPPSAQNIYKKTHNWSLN